MFFWQAGLGLILLEILVFSAVIVKIGFFKTAGLWLVSALAGGYLIQSQGIAAVASAQAAMDRGRPAGYRIPV